MKVSSMFALAALATFAGSAAAAPKLVKQEATKIEPTQVRKIKMVNGKIVPISAWKPYVGGNAGATDAPTFAWDGYDSSTPGLPGSTPDGNRYTLADGTIPYKAPVVWNDMTLANGFAGATSQHMDVVFSLEAGNPQFFMSVLTTEEAIDTTCTAPVTVYDGVQLGFSPAAGFYYSNIDLTSDPTLFWQLPMDGVGGVLIFLDQDQAFTPAIAQMGLWFTGEDMASPEARAGTNTEKYGADDQTTPATCVTVQALTGAQNVPDGVLDLSCECHDYVFGAPEGDPLTTCLAFAAEGGAVCYADCDLSNSLDIDDFICFQTLFAIGDPYADCDLSGSLDIDDFICFQTTYAVGC